MTPSPQGVGARVERAVMQSVEQVLQQQIASLKTELAALTVSRADIERQLLSADASDAVRLQKSLAAHDANIAGLNARLQKANIGLREISSRFQTAVMIPPPPPVPPPLYGIDPDAISAAVIIFAIGLVVPLSVAITRRLLRRPQPVVPPPDVETISKVRLERLEQSVDAIAIEIERISEGQRFVTKVLTERPIAVQGSNGEASEPQRLGDGASLRALGAGPMEPIRVAERQAVKQ